MINEINLQMSGGTMNDIINGILIYMHGKLMYDNRIYELRY